jgi:hypothetical protein
MLCPLACLLFEYLIFSLVVRCKIIPVLLGVLTALQTVSTTLKSMKIGNFLLKKKSSKVKKSNSYYKEWKFLEK